MPEAMDLAELRRGVEQIDLDDTLDYEEEVQLVYAALDLPTLDEAKAAIVEVLEALRAVSESGFPVGAEAELAELVGYSSTP